MVDHVIELADAHGQHRRPRQHHQVVEARIGEVQHRGPGEPAPEEGEEYGKLQYVRREHAPAHSHDAVALREAHRRHDHAQVQREARQLGRDVFLGGVEQAGQGDGGDVEHQRQEHHPHQAHRQIGLSRVKPHVDHPHQRTRQHVDHRRDHQRRQGEKVDGVGGEAVGVRKTVALPLLHVQGDQRRRDAGVEQQHRQIEQAVGRNIGVVGDARAEVVRQYHVPDEARDLAQYDDHRHQHCGLEDALCPCQKTDLRLFAIKATIAQPG